MEKPKADPRTALPALVAALGEGLHALAALHADPALTDDERRDVRMAQAGLTQTWQSLYVFANRFPPKAAQ